MKAKEQTMNLQARKQEMDLHTESAQRQFSEAEHVLFVSADQCLGDLDRHEFGTQIKDRLKTGVNAQPYLPAFDVLPSEIGANMWGDISRQSFCQDVNNIYNEIVHFRRNIFNIPPGSAGNSFIKELTFWLKQFNSNSDLNSIALKAFMVLPTLIFQKPSVHSKSKEHSTTI